MTHFPTISYTSISGIPTLSYGPKAWKSNPLSWRSLPVQSIIREYPQGFEAISVLHDIDLFHLCLSSLSCLSNRVLRKSWWNDFQQKKQRMRLDVFFFRTKTGSLTCVWWVSLTERLQTGAVSLQKSTIVWLFQDLGKLPSQLAKHRFNHKAAVILACVESVSNRVIELFLLYSFFVLLSSQLSWRTRAETLATQTTGPTVI